MDIERARRILLCLRYGIGDVVMELPVLDALRRRAPNSRLTVLGAPPALSLLEGDDRVDELVSIARFDLTHRWDRGTAAGRAAIARWLDSANFDLLVDVHHAATAVGEVVRGRGIRTLEASEEAERAAVAAGHGAVAAIHAAVRDGWGIDVPDGALPRIALRDEEIAAARAFLDRRRISGVPAALSPEASAPLKRWPPERFAALADWLVERTGTPVLVFHGPDSGIADAIRSAMRAPEHMFSAGALPLRHVAALLAHSAILVANDTGLLHLAAAVGTPVIGIFGPSNPYIYRPPADHAIALVDQDLCCPHRVTTSLQPPGCWNEERCLIAERSCVERVPLSAVLNVADTLLRPHHPTQTFPP